MTTLAVLYALGFFFFCGMKAAFMTTLWDENDGRFYIPNKLTFALASVLDALIWFISVPLVLSSKETRDRIKSVSVAVGLGAEHAQPYMQPPPRLCSACHQETSVLTYTCPCGHVEEVGPLPMDRHG